VQECKDWRGISKDREIGKKCMEAILIKEKMNKRKNESIEYKK